MDYFKIEKSAERNKQIQHYNRVKSSVKAAQAIEEIRKKLNLTQRFEELKDLFNMKAADEWNLLAMNQNMEKTIDILKNIR